jgi:hypothetical protein
VPETKYVKIVFDGQSYWLLWRWNPYLDPAPGALSGDYRYATGPFNTVEDAKKTITEGWTTIDFKAAT